MQNTTLTPLHSAVESLRQEWAEQLHHPEEEEEGGEDMQRALALSLASNIPRDTPRESTSTAIDVDALLRAEQDAAYAAAMEADLRRRQAAPARTESVPTPAAPPPPAPPPVPACPCEPEPGQPAVRLRIQLYSGDYGTHAFAPTALVSDIVRWAQHRLQCTTPMTVFDPIRKRALDPARTLAWHGVGAAQLVRVLCGG